MKRLVLLSVLLLFAAVFVFSADFGLLVDQQIEAENDLFTYTPGFTPWFSWNNGRGLSLYLSGILSLKYSNYYGDLPGENGWMVIPEVARFALNYRINQQLFLEAGRIGYTDVLDFTATGLFDGLRFESVTSAGRISVGAFYTGLLYKETAKIIMTTEDAAEYARPWDWNSFGEYAASKRLFAFLRWDIPVGDVNNFSVEVLGQFDLNGNDETHHSQYGTFLFDFYQVSKVKISVGGLFEAMQNTGDFGAAFGVLARLRMELPTAVNDMLGFTMKFSSGSVNKTLAGFTPISCVPQGSVFDETLSGLANIGADYSVRVARSLFVEGALRYFIKTYNDDIIEGNLYGGEIWASCAWQPLEDIRVILGGGLFLPGLGNVYPSGTDVMWKIIAGITLSF